MELNKLLSFFAKKINTKLGDDDVFLKKYQKNLNSVFTEKDFEKLKKDLASYAEIDFNENDISYSELIQLYNSKVDKENKKYSIDDLKKELQTDMKSFETGEADPSKLLDTDSSQPEDVSASGFSAKPVEHTPEDLAIEKKYSAVFGDLDETWSLDHVKYIAGMSENAIKRFDSLVSLLPKDSETRDRMYELYDPYSLISISESDLTEEEFQKSKAFLAKGLTPVDIMSFMGQVPERAETLEQVIGILTEGMPAQEAKELIYIESSSIVELLTGDAEKYAKAQRLMSECKDKITPDNLISASFLCEETSEKEFDKVLDLLKVSPKEKISTMQLIKLVQFDGEAYEQGKVMFQDPEYEGIDIAILLEAPENLRVKIKDYVKASNLQFSQNNFRELCNLKEDELEHLKQISGLKFGEKKLEPDLLIRLAKCSDENIDKVKSIKIEDTKITPELLTYMAEAGDDRLNNFIISHPNYTYEIKDLKKSIIIRNSEDGNIVIRYMQGMSAFETIENNVETHTSEKTAVNGDIRRRQQINYKRIPDTSSRVDFVESQTIQTFDKDGKLLKTEVSVPGALPGVPNITEISADGSRRILQSSKVDKNGTMQVVKDFESPDGTITQIQNFEDVLGNRRSIYKITDKDGNVLLNRTQTFKILGENKFQSGINGHNFEIEYKENEIKITDLESGKVSNIPMNGSIIAEDKNSIMKILQNMQAEQLMVMTLNSIDIFRYDGSSTDFLNNAYWKSENKEIYLGESTYMDSQTDFIRQNFSILSHEFGHYIDSTAGQLESGCISSLDKINEVFQKEYEEFKKVATSEEEGFIDYFTGTIQGADRAAEERVAEANMLLHANPAEQLATRAYYFQRYFPRTIAIIAEEISKVEQQAITKE